MKYSIIKTKYQYHIVDSTNTIHYVTYDKKFARGILSYIKSQTKGAIKC